MLKKIISATYTPAEFGIKRISDETSGRPFKASIRYARECEDYSMYGEDADLYKVFETEGFTVSKEFLTLEQAFNWFKAEVGQR